LIENYQKSVNQISDKLLDQGYVLLKDLFKKEDISLMRYAAIEALN